MASPSPPDCILQPVQHTSLVSPCKILRQNLLSVNIADLIRLWIHLSGNSRFRTFIPYILGAQAMLHGNIVAALCGFAIDSGIFILRNNLAESITPAALLMRCPGRCLWYPQRDLAVFYSTVTDISVIGVQPFIASAHLVLVSNILLDAAIATPQTNF